MICELCGSEFDDYFVEEFEDLFLDKNYCSICRGFKVFMHRKEEEKNE